MAGRHSAPPRRDRMLRRLAPLAVGLAAAVALVVWVLVPDTGRAGRDAAPTTTSPPPSSTTTSVPPTTTTTTDPGTLPQTDTPPSAASPQFQAAMRSLFGAVVAGTPATAHAAFFPESAYLQVKDIADAAGDFRTRLLAAYDLDIVAAHELLGPGAPTATLAAVDVPGSQAHWVPPGTCANGVGYYEVANARLVYTEGGVTRSFGIASLISWRGEWYVVHLGAVVRSGSGGTVLDPEQGPGSSPSSSTC